MLPSSTGLQSSPSPTHRRDPTRATRKGKKASSHRRYIDTAFETRAAPRAATATASLRSTSGESSSPKNHSCEAGESPKTPARTDTKRSGDGSRKRAALPDPVRARADVADERMLVRERHAPAMADAAESAVERQPPRVSGRGRPVSGELPPSRCGGALGRVSECQQRCRDVVLAPPPLETGTRVAASRRARSVRVHRRRAPSSRPRLLPAPGTARRARAPPPDVPHRVAQDGGADGHRHVASRGGGEGARAAAPPRRARRGQGGEEARRYIGGRRARRGGTSR